MSKLAAPSHRYLAELWLAIGECELAEKHALAAYSQFGGEGEPFVFRYGLKKATATLRKLGRDAPKMDPFDPSKSEKLPWEDAVAKQVETAKKRRASDMADQRRTSPEVDYDA